MRIIERESSVIGRFGREGVIHGSVSGHVLDAEWRDRTRQGWLKLAFDPSYKRCECEYGTETNGKTVLGHAVLTKIERSPRHA